MKWDTAIIIDNYLVQVSLKQKEGVYYAQADSFFLVASSGKTLNECLESLKIIYLRVREVVYKNFIKECGL